MGWPAVSRFGMLVCIAASACGGARSTTGGSDQAIGNTGAPLAQGDTDISASYWCSIRSGEYEYPAMPCVVSRGNGGFRLEKLAGSQRFRGVVKPQRDGGFTFDGEFYCPWGDCTQPLHGVFAAMPDGRLRGTFDDKTIVVTMTRAPDGNAFGGAGYGGASYGGFGGQGYGGMTYGGSSYGGQQQQLAQPPRN